jgi:hypothetical protein
VVFLKTVRKEDAKDYIWSYERGWQEDEKNCVMRSFMICTFHQL